MEGTRCGAAAFFANAGERTTADATRVTTVATITPQTTPRSGSTPPAWVASAALFCSTQDCAARSRSPHAEQGRREYDAVQALLPGVTRRALRPGPGEPEGDEPAEVRQLRRTSAAGQAFPCDRAGQPAQCDRRDEQAARADQWQREGQHARRAVHQTVQQVAEPQRLVQHDQERVDDERREVDEGGDPQPCADESHADQRDEHAQRRGTEQRHREHRRRERPEPRRAGQRSHQDRQRQQAVRECAPDHCWIPRFQAAQAVSASAATITRTPGNSAGGAPSGSIDTTTSRSNRRRSEPT